MKKKVFTIVILLGIILITKAQENYFGLKGGLNLVTLNGNNNLLNYRPAFHLGFALELGISNNFSIQPELMYSEQGNSLSLKYDYLNLPIMAKYYLSEGLSLELGPQLGVLLSAKSEFNDAESENVKKTDFGVNIGLGYKIGNSFNIGTRYNIGLSNIKKEVGYYGKVRNGVIQFFIGYFL